LPLLFYYTVPIPNRHKIKPNISSKQERHLCRLRVVTAFFSNFDQIILNYMKKLLVLLSVLILSHTAFAQMDGSYNNSIAIQAFGVLQVPKILNESNKDKYINTSFNGLMIKFNDNQISFRISGSYFNKNININDVDATTGKMTDYAFKVGFEKNFNYSRIQPYFLMDLGYRSNDFDGTINATTLANISKSGILLAPGFGLKINALKALTLFAEGNLEFFYYQGKDDTTAQGSTVTTSSKYYKSQFLLNPVSAGLQFHFGSNN
jgi:hypothetical protein